MLDASVMKPVKPSLSTAGVGYINALFSLSCKNARADFAPTKVRATNAPGRCENEMQNLGCDNVKHMKMTCFQNALHVITPH